MTPHEFVTIWRHANLSERAAAQSHFIDLCRLLGQPDPISADPSGEWFTFQKGTRKASGGRGWADVWRRGCFAWEYQSKGADLAAAAVLKKRTLTNLYNARPAWLDHADAALDRAVAEAYGWGEDWRAGRIPRCPFALNQQG